MVQRWGFNIGAGLFTLGLGAASCTSILGIDEDYHKPIRGTGGSGGGRGSGGTGGSATTTSADGQASAASSSGGSIPVLWPDSASTLCVVNDKATSCPVSKMTDYVGQDGDHLINVPTYQVALEGTDRTFTDTVTGLVWQGNFSAIKNRDINWVDALTACKDLSFAGKTDWRLPSRRELASLLDFGRPNLGSPTSAGVAPILPEVFEELVVAAEASATYYWTDARAQDDPVKAWAFLPLHSVNATIEASQTNAKNARAMCVRGTLAYRTPQFIHDGEVVRDATTGLVWQLNIVSAGLVWTQALAYCNTLKLNNESGFRLPNVKELLYLVDDTQQNPAIDMSAFPVTPVNMFWTSTPFAGVTTRAFAVDFTRGEVVTTDQASPHLVRCVR